MLENLVLFKGCSCDEESVLKVNLVLLVVVLVCELDKAVSREVSVLTGNVCNLSSPYFVGLVERNIVCSFRLDACILCCHHCISCTVATLGLVLVEWLAYRLP